jgi:hypothetical protein
MILPAASLQNGQYRLMHAWQITERDTSVLYAADANINHFLFMLKLRSPVCTAAEAEASFQLSTEGVIDYKD